MYETIRATLYWDSIRNKEDLNYWYDYYNNKGIYALFRKYDEKLKVSYIGIADKLNTRLYQQSVKPTSRFKIADIDIKDGYLTRKKLELIEHALIYTIQPGMNKNKKNYPPKDNIVIINKNISTHMPHRIEIKNWSRTKNRKSNSYCSTGQNHNAIEERIKILNKEENDKREK